MNKKILLPVLLLLLITPTLANVNYTEEYCQDNDTLVTEHYYDNGTVNITTKKEYTNPYYGCSNGSAVQPSDHMEYGLVTAVGLALFIAINLGLVVVIPKGKHGSIKFAILFMTLISLFYFSMVLGTIGNEYQHLEETSELIFNLSNVYFWFMFLVISYFIVILLKNLVQGFTGKGGKDYSTWDTR